MSVSSKIYTKYALVFKMYKVITELSRQGKLKLQNTVLIYVNMAFIV